MRSRFDGFSGGVPTFLQLKTLTYTGDSLRALNRAWPHLGKSLERIELTSIHVEHNERSEDASSWATCIELLQLHCRKLTSIFLWNPFDDNEKNG